MKRNGQSNKRGFTIVELLIVIVVIGILAAIVIVAFTGIQTRARNAMWQSEFNAYHRLFMAYQAKNGQYPSMPIGNRYCLGTDNAQAGEINPAISASGDSAATPIPTPFNPGGYCRDLFYSLSRHEASTTLTDELSTIGKVPSRKKTRADIPDQRMASMGVIVSYQAYTSDPQSGIWLGVILNNPSGNCPSSINGRKYDYPTSDAVYCEIRLPEAPF